MMALTSVGLLHGLASTTLHCSISGCWQRRRLVHDSRQTLSGFNTALMVALLSRPESGDELTKNLDYVMSNIASNVPCNKFIAQPYCICFRVHFP